MNYLPSKSAFWEVFLFFEKFSGFDCGVWYLVQNVDMLWKLQIIFPEEHTLRNSFDAFFNFFQKLSDIEKQIQILGKNFSAGL